MGVVQDTFSQYSGKTLESISSLGLKHGLVSKFDNRLEGILRGCDLLFHFTKPDPAIFRQTLEKSGVPDASVVHIGDHYVYDYLTSQSLGLHGYLLGRQGRDKYPDAPHSIDKDPRLLIPAPSVPALRPKN
uniref:Haloacid dehalogenase-like hydrolase domain-containing protein 3 n=1 Tax=Oncorhynchus tshawytscha TaxID=74940 RepID=A0AAZ3SR45_ONCTS